jgi:hypothetical protein
MQYLGDYAEDYATLNFKFSTHKADGTPIALAGTPVVSVYKANGTTQSTAGITLSVDFDSVTGLNNVLIDLSADAFYAVGNDYSVVITTGTVNSVSVVGTVLAHFSIENRFESQTGDAYAVVNSRLPAALESGNIQAIVKAQDNIDFGAAQKASLNAASVTVSDKTGFSLSSAGIQAIWDALTSSLTTVGSIGKLIIDYLTSTLPTLISTLIANPGAGAGTIQHTYTITDSSDGTPIDGVEVWVSTDAAGVNVIASGYTNSSGIINFMLDAGTYYFWRKRSGYNFTNPDLETVEA